ncbi:hypothetical protein RJ639_015555 [Escallonia herrerae]|uniref:L-ascorbate oxidase n=1 Tax=Escallonia herrerae TaxID=1293975 RepID=A0AA88VBV8_9ASTE|nr:hypothetical protein RJ639_015555 [Escallonia herrerae]
MGSFTDYPCSDARKFLLLWCCLSVLAVASLGSKTRHFKWQVEYLYWSPDGVENVVMGINGRFPGPTISAKVGDTISVHLTNKLQTEGVVIHWHGIRQFGTPWADGTASISQCVINPGENFVYRFEVDKAGTFFYHGHYGMQRSAGLYGSLIVDVAEGKREPFHYDGEFSLLLSDWWHKDVHQQEVDLTSKPFRWIGEPQVMTLTLKKLNDDVQEDEQTIRISAFDSANQRKRAVQLFPSGALWQLVVVNTVHAKGKRAVRAPDSPRAAEQDVQAEGGQHHRIGITQLGDRGQWVVKDMYLFSAILRTLLIIHVSFVLVSQNHSMIVVEADGNYLQPFSTTDMDIYSGETYSVLFTTNQDPSKNYWISASVRGREPKTPQALTILNYSPISASNLPPSLPPVSPRWDDYDHSKSFTNKILSLMGSPKPPSDYHRRISLLNTQNTINGYTRWAINNVSLSLPTSPYLGSIKFGLNNAFDRKNPPDNFSSLYEITNPPVNPNSTYGNGVYMLDFNTTIDVILQNANALKANVSEIHPWHLHGHDFWVLGYGQGKFSAKDEAKFNLKNPPLRNTAVIFPYGWTALRFVANNPGAWAFHCHIEPHLHMGMGVVFAEGVHHVGRIPNEALACGLTGKMLMNNNRN